MTDKKTRYDFDHSKIEGTDACIEISLKEYGLAWVENEEEILFYYGVEYAHDYIYFDMARFTKPINVYKEFDWADFGAVCDYADDFKKVSVVQHISTVLNYYGFENVFGSRYWEGLTYEEIFLSEKEMDERRNK